MQLSHHQRRQANRLDYQLMVDSIQDYAIFMLDPDGFVVTWNQGAQRIKGYSPEEAIGRHFSCFYSEEDIHAGLPVKGLQQATSTGRFETRGWRIRKDGSRFWARVVITALHDPDGRLSGFAKVTYDLTEMKCQEEEMAARFRQRNEEWRMLFEYGPVSMVKIDLSGRLLEVNQKFCEMLGYTAEELKEKTYRDLGTPEDISIAQPYLQRIMAGEIESYTREKTFIRKDRTEIVCESSLSLVRDSSGEPLYMIGVGTDITERKRADQARRESELAYRTIFEQAAVGMVHTNLSGQIIRVNRRYADIIGYTPEECIGMTFQSITHEDDLASNLQIRGSLLAGHIPNFCIEKRICRKNGTIGWVRLTVSLGHNPEENVPTHTIAIVEDITAQKKTEQQLAESQQRLALAVSASGLGIWELDANHQVFWFSDTKARMLGISDSACELSVNAFMALVHPDDRTMILERMWQMISEGKAQHVEYRLCRPDGALRWLEVRGQPVCDGLGEGSRFMGVTIDITARKQTEQQLRQLSNHIQQAREDERKSLAREIHDELGSALTAIKFDLTLPCREGDTEDDCRLRRNRESIGQVDTAITSLRRIISDLRPSVLDDMGLWAALEWLAQEFYKRTGVPCQYLMCGKEITVEAEAATALFRMVQEALTNVKRHAHASIVTIQIKIRPRDIAIRIQDNGVGIAPERVRGSQSYGLLGLRERARQFNGKVRIYGRPGQGTVVGIRMPRPGPAPGQKTD